MRVTLAPDVWRSPDGVVVGGTPTRLFRLSAAGADALARWCDGGEPAEGAETSLVWRLIDAGVLDPLPGGSAGASCGHDDQGEDGVTVVVPVHGRVTQLEVALGKLRDAHRGSRIVVVDDASPDPAGIVAVAARHDAEVVRRDRQGGPAAARNHGLAAVATPFVAFVDSDVEVHPGWHRPLLAILALDDVVIAAPRVRTPSGTTARDRYDAARSPLDLGRRPAPVRPASRVAYVPAAALVARTDAIRSLGGFDETMTVGEDVDLVWRAHRAGWRVRYVPSVGVLHRDPPERGSLLKWAARRMAYGTSAAALDQRHPAAVTPLVTSVYSLAAWGLALFGRPAAGAAVAGGTSVALVAELGGVPARRAVLLGVRGHLAAGEALAHALIRPWWPASLVAAALSRRARRALVVAAVVPALLDRRRRRAAVAPIPWVIWSLVEDVSYGAGVWLGAIRARSVASLRPRVFVTGSAAVDPAA